VDPLTLVAIAAGVVFYITMVAWTVAACLRVNPWLIPLVVIGDHLVFWFLAALRMYPLFIVWKLWCFWVAAQMEPWKELPWTPRLGWWGRPRAWRVTAGAMAGLGGLAMLAVPLGWIQQRFGPPAALWTGVAALGMLGWWVVMIVRGRQRSRAFREPALWEAGPCSR
jgi:hypothetical protein